MARAGAAAGFAYFLVVFAIGFAIGAVRVLLVEPRLGPVWSVAGELPVMLAASWFVARQVVARFAVADVGTAAATGIVGLVCLVVAETLLGLAFGQDLSAQLAGYGTARGALTLAGQLGFAAMPLVAWRFGTFRRRAQ